MLRNENISLVDTNEFRYRISEFDSFDVPIGIYSNVENGWGIFGGAGRTQIVIHY